MQEIQGGVSGKGSIEALISPFRPLAQYQRTRQHFSELRHSHLVRGIMPLVPNYFFENGEGLINGGKPTSPYE